MLIKIKDLKQTEIFGSEPLSDDAELLGVYINRDTKYYSEYDSINEYFDVILRPYETSDMLQFDVSEKSTYVFDVDTITVTSESGDVEESFLLNITTDLSDMSLPYGSVVKRAVMQDFIAKTTYLTDGGVSGGYIIKHSTITLKEDITILTDFTEFSHNGDAIYLINRVDFDVTDTAVVDPLADKVIRIDWNDGVGDWRTYYNINIDTTLQNIPEYSNTYGYLLYQNIYIPATTDLNIRSLYDKTSKVDLLAYVDSETIEYYELDVTDIEEITDTTVSERNDAYSLWNDYANNMSFTYQDIQSVGHTIIQTIKNRIDYLIANVPEYDTVQYKRLSIYFDYILNEDPAIIFNSSSYLLSGLNEQSDEIVEQIVDELHDEWVELAQNYNFWQIFSKTYFVYWKKMFIFAYNLSVNEKRIVYTAENYTIQASVRTMEYLLEQPINLGVTFSDNVNIMAVNLRNMVKKVDTNDWLNSLV